MTLRQWLLEHDARLNILLDAQYDPNESEPQLWQCEIGGVLETNGTRPATFILTPSGAVTARAATPEGALHDAVCKMRGVQLNVIYRSRNDTFTFPIDLTV